ncbi:MerR family transcriptional regulator [Kribbella solani]|uniref:DNA-binding transcriptional MerR regulator n=1 Tax=Kribbella solani TaxID=236067 RepID=A0A841DQZ2_9ACTN|nr:MerR family transcriptional regulator [Kribbella solani]MBB5978777.1 DNA-binding transcriptional MerR regulator [Kribbella solani]MDX2968795.1 MerR family transcriptional regulator [Kribbella solani]MDX3000504.1 MerR family transcriptional regulator [Kribbella solani]
MARPEPSTEGPADGRGIGEVLQLLQAEFADVTISKIRFLEAEGLVTPARTASGYRKFSAADVERLRYVLTAQRDQYLPLKVIKEHLGAIDRGLRPAAAGPPVAPASLPQTPGQPVADDFGAASTELRLTREELRTAAGVSAELLGELESHGLVVASGNHYSGDAIVIAQVAAELAGYGLEPRHLRAFRTAADREVGLIEQVTGPRRTDQTAELAALTVRLHTALVRSRLPR